MDVLTSNGSLTTCNCVASITQENTNVYTPHSITFFKAIPKALWLSTESAIQSLKDFKRRKRRTLGHSPSVFFGEYNFFLHAVTCKYQITPKFSLKKRDTRPFEGERRIQRFSFLKFWITNGIIYESRILMAATFVNYCHFLSFQCSLCQIPEDLALQKSHFKTQFHPMQ